MIRLLSIEETAECLGVKVATLYTWTSQRKVPFIKVGKLVKFDERDLNKWIEQRRVASHKQFVITEAERLR